MFLRLHAGLPLLGLPQAPFQPACCPACGVQEKVSVGVTMCVGSAALAGLSLYAGFKE